MIRKLARNFSNFASRVAMIDPAHLKSNPETAEDNKFMSKASYDTTKCMNEFNSFVARLRELDIQVKHWHNPDPKAPDATFLNNWFSTHSTIDTKQRVLFIYPMKHPSRQRERRREFIQDLEKDYDKVIDLSYFEKPEYGNLALESTGVLIFDRKNHRIFVNLSERASEKVLEEYLKQLNAVSHKEWKLVTFHGKDKAGFPIYHTNVVMGLTPNCAIINLSCITDQIERNRVVDELSGYNIVEISHEDMSNMCGNLLSLYSPKLKSEVVVLSDKCRKANLKLDCEQIFVNIPTIEEVGGGSARCMLGELF